MDAELTPSVPVTPSETKTEEPVVVETPVETPAAEAPKLYKLPDGREVDADGLKAEYENLLPEFTRKSQRVAELERAHDPNINNLPEWKKEGYVPKSYAELVELGKQEALAEIARVADAEQAERTRITAAVDAQVSALKAKDPKLDENALFAHANKYGFRDLGLAYENMSALKTVELATEQRLKAKPKPDPIATGSGAGAGSVPRYPQATSATEFLSRLKK